jgi:metal-dependent amidase/aminoacylase/carboxypeptidase family protein
MAITFTGKPSHAAEPENGVSPTLPITWLLLGLNRLADTNVHSADFKGITVVHVSIGDKGAYGVCPGNAVLASATML